MAEDSCSQTRIALAFFASENGLDQVAIFGVQYPQAHYTSSYA
jgi:hypothetical protein